MWHAADIADAIAVGLARRAEALDHEQAVRGLDGRDELALHPDIEHALRDAGFGVYREQRYPADRTRRRISEGERCDFVLTRDGQPLQSEPGRATLFDSPDAAPLDDAFWLEAKTVSQFLPERPNAGYSAQLLSPVRKDVSKLSKEPGILHAGVLLVLFVESQAVAEHDLRIWQDRCLQRGLPIEAPSVRHFPINDRLGNAHCCVAVYPVRHL